MRHAFFCIAYSLVPEGTSIDCRFERRHPRCLGLACAVRRYRPCGSVRQAYLAIVCRGAPSPHSRREASGWTEGFQLFFPRTARQKASGAAGHNGTGDTREIGRDTRDFKALGSENGGYSLRLTHSNFHDHQPAWA